MDPKDYIITRKRKKYKFALFFNSPLCFEAHEWPRDKRIDVIEVGAGNAHFLVELASRHPEQVFAALDVKGDRLQSGARKAEELGLANIFFIRARADQIDELFAAHSLSTIWLTFSDPFPKKRSAGRRMSHPTYLKKYATVLATQGDFIIKHDNPDFFQWSLEQLVIEKWYIIELSFDLHESELDEDYKILTAYEQRWLNEGRRTYFVRAKSQ
jgi:tRNA (guanine-N7-)-methyltransferase